MSTNNRNFGPLNETHQKVQALLDGRDKADRQRENGPDGLDRSATNRPTRDIGSLHATHQKVHELLASRSPQEQQIGRAHDDDRDGPSRPTDQPLQRPRPPGVGGMEANQTYAADLIKFNAALRRQGNGGGEREREDAFYKRHPDLVRDGDGAKRQEPDQSLQRHGPSR